MSWTVFWKDRGGGPEVRSSNRSREVALDAACNLSRYETLLRIEGPNGEVIDREAIEQLRTDRPRR
jgi:hypothetical protein